MFEVKIMVDDKKLTKLLWALDGLIAGQPQLLPVRGAKVVRSSTGETKVKQKYDGSIRRGFIESLVRAHIEDPISHTELRELMVAAGGLPNSTSSVVALLHKSGVLKRVGRGRYTVNQAKATQELGV